MKNMRKTKLPQEGSSPEMWDNRELGASEKYVRKSSTTREKAVDHSLGLKTISIRLQKTLIDAIKDLAKDDGIGYQPYIRQILMRHVRREKAKQGKHVETLK